MAERLLLLFGTVTLLRAMPLLHMGHEGHTMTDTPPAAKETALPPP